MPIIASIVGVDVALWGSILGILVILLGGVIRIASLLNSIENRFIEIESREELNLHKIKSSLRLLRYELENVKGYLDKATDFQPRNIDPNTGADFMNEPDKDERKKRRG